ncbi:PAS domain S-box protein [Methanocella sp. MCL-LM]|uniref:PAS domain S-box protein n=1 Tax=Methanocella sp. MCL-LM TaxID=3412035 RepID=UPI003C77320F
MKVPHEDRPASREPPDKIEGPGEKSSGKCDILELREKLEKTNRALRAISRCNEAMVRIGEEAVLLKAVCDIIVEYGGYKMAWIGFVLNDPRRTIKPVANSGADSRYLENLKIILEDNVLGRGPVGTAARTKKPAIVRNVLTDPCFVPWRSRAVEQGFASMISLPLIADSELIGVLSIDSEKTDEFGDEDVVLLQELANNLAFGIKSIRSRAERDHAEEALRESEEKFKTLAESSTAAIFVYQGEHYVSVNEAAARMTGYTQAELLKLNIMDIIHPDFRELVRQRARARQLGEPAPPIYEAKIVTKSGEAKWILLSAARIIYGGKPAGVATLIDITERKRAEEALLLTQFAMDHAPDSSIWADEEGRIIYVNDAACETTGFTRSEFLSMHIWDFDRNSSKDKFQKRWNSMPDPDKQRVRTRFETVARTKSGRLYPVEVTTEFFSYKGTRYLISFGREITERKQAEKEREHLLYEIDGQRRRLQTILESLPVGLFIVDTGGRITMANHIARNYHGGTFPITLDELAKIKTLWADTGKVVRKEELGIFRSLARGELISKETIEIEDAKGNSVALLCSSAPLLDARGNITGAVSISLDITGMRKLENELGRSKRQAELYLDLMGHDIANMNHALLGYLELIAIACMGETAENEMISSSLQIINRSSRLIDQVKKLTGLQKGEVPPKDVDLNQLIEAAKSSVPLPQDRQVTIEYDSRPGRQYLVKHSDLLKDALENLIDNAIKHSSGPLTVTISVDRVTKDGRLFYRVCVEDNGPGVPDELKKTIFMTVEELEEKTARRGFGLYFVKTVIDYYQGSVWVEDRVPGDYRQGSRFVLRLPASSVSRA